MEYTKLLGKVTLTTDGLHDSAKSYDRLCLVYDSAYRSFISIKDVPANVSIDNRSYWQPLSIITADNEDLMVDENLRIKFADKEYAPLENSGMGYKILRKRKNNILTQDDFEAHTLYVVEYDFYLGGETIIMPEDCAIYFKGGTINGGTLTGTDTIAYGTVTRKGDATFDGTWLESGSGSGDLSELEARVDRLEQAMFPYKLTVTGGGVYKEGTTTSVTVRRTFTQGSTEDTPDDIKINGESIATNQTSKTYLDVSTDTTYTVVVTKAGVEYTGTAKAVFVNPSYFGVVISNFTPTEDAIKNLSSGDIIKDTKTYTTPAFTQNAQKNCYAYPKSFGILTNIRDYNNQNLNDSYEHTEVAVNNEMYYVYVLKTPSTVTNYKITFN